MLRHRLTQYSVVHDYVKSLSDRKTKKIFTRYLLTNDNTVLVVVDINRPSITDCPDLLKLCKAIVVLDHHRQGTESIENATLSYVEPYASSACEMVAEILQYVDNGEAGRGGCHVCRNCD